MRESILKSLSEFFTAPPHSGRRKFLKHSLLGTASAAMALKGIDTAIDLLAPPEIRILKSTLPQLLSQHARAAIDFSVSKEERETRTEETEDLLQLWLIAYSTLFAGDALEFPTARKMMINYLENSGNGMDISDSMKNSLVILGDKSPEDPSAKDPDAISGVVVDDIVGTLIAGTLLTNHPYIIHSQHNTEAKSPLNFPQISRHGYHDTFYLEDSVSKETLRQVLIESMRNNMSGIYRCVFDAMGAHDSIARDFIYSVGASTWSLNLRSSSQEAIDKSLRITDEVGHFEVYIDINLLDHLGLSDVYDFGGRPGAISFDPVIIKKTIDYIARKYSSGNRNIEKKVWEILTDVTKSTLERLAAREIVGVSTTERDLGRYYMKHDAFTTLQKAGLTAPFSVTGNADFQEMKRWDGKSKEIFFRIPLG